MWILNDLEWRWERKVSLDALAMWHSKRSSFHRAGRRFWPHPAGTPPRESLEKWLCLNMFEHIMVSCGISWYSPLVSFHQLSRPRQYVGICRAAWQIILESRHRRRFARFDSGNSSSDGSKSLSASSSAFLLPGSLIYYDISGMSKHGRTKDLILAWKHLRCQL